MKEALDRTEIKTTATSTANSLKFISNRFFRLLLFQLNAGDFLIISTIRVTHKRLLLTEEIVNNEEKM